MPLFKHCCTVLLPIFIISKYFLALAFAFLLHHTIFPPLYPNQDNALDGIPAILHAHWTPSTQLIKYFPCFLAC